MKERQIAESLLEFLSQIETDNSNFARWDDGDINQDDVRTIAYHRWMCVQVINHPEWDTGKSNRWIGCIQWGSILLGWTSLDAERDRVRQIKVKGV